MSEQTRASLPDLLERLRHDPTAAVDIRAAAVAGDVEAQFVFGQLFLEGKGVAHDAVEGLHWYALAASAGHALAANMMGRCHELGIGTVADAERAAAWYRRAADAGLDWGMYNLAHLHATGRGVPVDQVQARDLYRRAAELGHAKAMNFLGRYLEEGIAGDADPVAAIHWYRRSAEGGDFRGQASYAAVLAAAGDTDAALALLEQAIAQGSPSFLREMASQLPLASDPRIRALALRIAV